jgi:hypothetical protein
MSIFDLGDGSTTNIDATEADSGGGEFTPIPAKTQCLAVIESALWVTFKEDHESAGEKYIELTWVVSQPPEFKNRKVKQKVRVHHEDTDKRKKALDMAVAIDNNSAAPANAKLRNYQSWDKVGDVELAKALVQARMIVMMQIYKFGIIDKRTGEPGEMSGNWINKVSPYKPGETLQRPEPIPKSVAAKPTATDFDADIPF